MMSPAPPPVTPSRKLPPRFGVPPLVAVDVPPHAASGPASITPPANTPALISRRRRVSELVLRSPGRSISVSAIDFLLLDVFTAFPQNDSVGDRGSFSSVVRAVPGEEPRLSCWHGGQRCSERPQVGQLGFGDQGPGCPDLDRLAGDVHVEAILEQLGLDEGAVVHAVLDQAFLDQLPDRLTDGAAADPQHLDQAGLTKLLTGWDPSIDDSLADDAADGFGGGMALEGGQGPDGRRGHACGHRDHGRIVGRSTRESITKIFPLPLAGEGQGGGLTTTPSGSRPSSTARTERVAWRTTSCSAARLYQAACGVTIRRG